jgi:hypothetical protein
MTQFEEMFAFLMVLLAIVLPVFTDLHDKVRWVLSFTAEKTMAWQCL